jgi:hypothetical protein
MVFNQGAEALTGFDMADLDINTVAPITQDVGTYSYDGTDDIYGNYKVSFSDGLIDVTPRNITVNLADVTRVYGDANSQDATSYIASIDNMVFNQGAEALTGFGMADLDINTVAPITQDVGTYSYDGDDDIYGNYNVSFSAAKQTITPRLLELELKDVARVYGDANSTKIIDYIDDADANYANNDSINNLGLSVADDLSNLPAITANVGDYGYSGNNDIRGNYSVSFTNTGQFTVEHAMLNDLVSFKDNLNVEYGEDYDATISDMVKTTTLLNGDKIADVINKSNLKIKDDDGNDVTNQVGQQNAYDPNLILQIPTGTYGNYQVSGTAITGSLDVVPATITIDSASLTGDKTAIRRYNELNNTTDSMVTTNAVSGLKKPMVRLIPLQLALIR